MKLIGWCWCRSLFFCHCHRFCYRAAIFCSNKIVYECVDTYDPHIQRIKTDFKRNTSMKHKKIDSFIVLTLQSMHINNTNRAAHCHIFFLSCHLPFWYGVHSFSLSLSLDRFHRQSNRTVATKFVDWCVCGVCVCVYLSTIFSPMKCHFVCILSAQKHVHALESLMFI